MQLPPLIWKPSPNFSQRKPNKIDLIVIHDCEGGYTGSIATFLSRQGGPAGPVSAHFVLREDGAEATQMVRLADKAWHCASFNSRSVGLEMAGFEKQGYAAAEWSSAAAITAYLCHKLGIPVRWATGGVGPGIARHLDLGRAGGGHSDPTLSSVVFQSFLDKVHAAFVAAPWSDSWGER